MIIFSEVVKVFDANSVQVSDDEELRFRIEISKELKSEIYSGKVYRLETYRLQPTFPQDEGRLPELQNDALIFVEDDAFDCNELKGSSIQEVLTKFEKIYNDIFSR